MKKRIIFIALALGIAGLKTGHTQPKVSESVRPILLKCAIFEPENSRYDVNIWKPWFAEVEKSTRGQIKIEPHYGGKIVGPADTWDAVTKGVVDIVFGIPTFIAGRFLLDEVVGLAPYSRIACYRPSRVYWELYKSIPAMQKPWSEVKVLWLWADVDGYQFTTKKPILKLEDMKGLKMIASGYIAEKRLKALGGVPVAVPPPGYTEMEKGVVEGFFGATDHTLWDFKFGDLVKYVTWTGGTMYNYFMVMNLQKWNTLSPDIQRTIEETIGDRMVDRIDKYLITKHSELRAKMLLDFPIRLISLPQQELDRWNATNKKAIEEGRVNEIEDPFQETELTGRYLKSARMTFDSSTGKPVVSLEFNDEGAKIFSKLTEKNVGKILAIYIDNQPISEPVVREKIPGGKAQIEGNFSVEEARELARNLSAGALPAPISLLSQKTVGAILGEKTFFNILRAGFFAVLTLLIFMVLYYRLFGFLIFFPLFVYFSFSLFIFLIFGVTLSLSAIAGFLLSLGMAIDANILIFSRTREELEKGDFLFAIKEGIKRAWPAIRDGNGTTLLVNIILFYFGESFVRGFALTLSLGILVSLFTQILIYKLMAEIVAETRLSKIKVLWK
ncbi:MAG: protein translocase subunit SecD [candidate division WOR-3 bacterium]